MINDWNTPQSSWSSITLYDWHTTFQLQTSIIIILIILCPTNTFTRVPYFGHCRLLLPWLRVLCWFFCNSGLKHCWHGQQRIEPTTLDFSSQSGALSATGTHGSSAAVYPVTERCNISWHTVIWFMTIDQRVNRNTTNVKCTWSTLTEIIILLDVNLRQVHV